MVSFKLEGAAELEQALKELPKATSRNVLKRAGTKALERVADRMAALAPYDEEDRDEDGQHLNQTMKVEPAKAKLARALGVPTKTGVVILAGPAPKGRRMRLVAQNLEFGTGERFHKESGKSTGILPAMPYARPAADAEAGNVLDDLKRELAEQIEKARARLAKKAARLAAKG